MRETIHYNIHDILHMEIRRDKRFPDLFRDINLRFSYFETNKTKDPELILNIGKFTPSKRETFLVDHQYQIGDGYFYCKDSDRTARWEMEIDGIEDSLTTVNFNGSILGLHEIVYPHILAQNLIGRYMLQYKLGQKGYFMIHAASVTKNDQAFVFAGRGGANKTSIIMDLVRNKGFSFQGDDWIIIKDDSVYSFPTHFQEFNFRANVLPSEHLRGNLDRFRLFSYLRRPFNYQNSGIEVTKSSKLKMLNILLKTNNEELKIIKDADKELVKKRLYYNNKIEENETSLSMGLKLKGVSRYLMAYSFIHPNNGFTRFMDSSEKALKRLIQNASCNIIEIPFKYDRSVADRIYSHLKTN